MGRRTLTRVLLVALGVVLVLLLVRSCSDDTSSNAVAYFDEFEVGELRHQAFAVEQPVGVEVQAIGSAQSDSVLAAYGWLIRREDRAIVWAMLPETVARDKGMLVETHDLIALEPGTYDLYFTTYGNPLLPTAEPEGFFEQVSSLLNDDFERWRTERGQWMLQLAPASNDGAANIRRVRGEADQTERAGETLIWQTGPVENDRVVEHFFQVTQPAPVGIYAIGEFHMGPRDYGWMENLSTGEQIWQMTDENTVPAGGSVKNRVFKQIVQLPAGRYRIGYVTDGNHAYGRWDANPPYDPAGWGLQLTTAEPSLVTNFDPWEQLPRLADLTPVEDDELRSMEFTLDQPLRVLVEATGEGTSRMYDYAWILKAGIEETVWEMTYEQTRHAGGARKNRQAEALLDLPPGTYTVFFRTDGSHAYDDWNSKPPDYPERWGVTVFALDPTYVPPPVPPTPTAPAPPAVPTQDVAVLADLSRLKNDAQVEQSFTLDEPTDVRIVANGEILLDRVDYGWITREDETVWEMTRQNTTYGGGARKNRKFDGVVRLPAGRYTVHFKTDGSHAFGDFQAQPPEDPNGWGIVVHKAE